MDTVHEQTEGNLRLKVVVDDDPSDPREDTQLGVMVCAHPDYQLGDKNVSDWLRALKRLGTRNFVRWLQAFHGTTVILPLYLLDHSGLSMRAGGGFGDVDPGGWDTSMVGFIFDTAERRELTGAPLDSIARQLTDEVEEYDRYLRGDAYGYVIEQLVTCDQGHEHASTVESLWGFPDDDDALGEGRSLLETLVKVEQLKAEAKRCTHCEQPIVRRDHSAGTDWFHVDFDNPRYESQRCEDGVEYAEPAEEPVEGELTILTIHERHGTITSLHRTHQGAKRSLAGFVGQAWDAVLLGPEPEDAQAAIDRYFADGDEQYYLDSATVED